jgi:alkylhydroperoxidase family enzyme
LVRAILDDHRTAPISARDKALFDLIEKVTRDSRRITQADIDAAKAAGFSDEALYDAFTVCALFQFYNTWVDACGVDDMTPELYAASGKRLATFGYEKSRLPG